MGVIPRRLIKDNLHKIEVLVNDTNNDYFNLFEFPEVFVQGRSAFKIAGSELLKPKIPLKIEILDHAGNTVYVAPVDIVGEEDPALTFRYVTVEVYPRPFNEPGMGLLTILGEIDPTKVDFDIPEEFQDSYNIKIQRKLNIDTSTVINTQPIRFYKQPTATAQELVKPKIVVTEWEATAISGSFIEGRARHDIFGATRNVGDAAALNQQETVENLSDAPGSNLEAELNNYRHRTGLTGRRSISSRRGTRHRRSSAQRPTYTVFITGSEGPFISQMVGGHIRVDNTKLSLRDFKRLDPTDRINRYFDTRLPGPLNPVQKYVTKHFTTGSYTSSIARVINGKQLVPANPYEVTYTYNSGRVQKVIADFGASVYTASYSPTTTTIYSSSYQYDSFANISIKNMRPFSGDIYRVKVHGASENQMADFAVLGDQIVESSELLVDADSVSGFLRWGYFIDQDHINNYWSSGSGPGDATGGNVIAHYSSSVIIDAMRLSGSCSGFGESIKYENKDDFDFTINKDVPLTLAVTLKGKKGPKRDRNGNQTQQGKLFFHLSGSNLAGGGPEAPQGFGQPIKDPQGGLPLVLRVKETHAVGGDDESNFEEFDRREITFLPSFMYDKTSNSDTKLQIRASCGEWHISDLSLRPAMDTGFSPDEFTIRVGLPRGTRPDKFDFIIEYYDINNNVAEDITYLNDIRISGSALVIDGTGNLLTGSLFMGNIQDSGIEAAGVESAYVRSVGYQGFTSASEQGHGGFMIWSGSVFSGSVDKYTGAGLEIHDGTTGASERYFKFRTKDGTSGTSIFDVKTDTFFLGQSTSTFISGAQGNLEISSSNFHVSASGDVTMIGTITAAAGSIGGWTVNSNNLVDSSNRVKLEPAGDYIISASDFQVGKGGDVTASAGLIGGWKLTTTPEALTSPNARITMSALTGTERITIRNASGLEMFRLGEISDAAGSLYGMKMYDGSGVYDDDTKQGQILLLGQQGNMIAGWEITPGQIRTVPASGFGGQYNEGESGLVIHASGSIETSDFVTGLKGWRISSLGNGTAEFENARIRGTLRTTVFEKESVNVVGGQLMVANSTTLQALRDAGSGSKTTGSVQAAPRILAGVPSMSATSVTMSVANASGFVKGEIIKAKKVSDTGFSVEYMYVTGSKRFSEDPALAYITGSQPSGAAIDPDGLAGELYVGRGYGQIVQISGSITSTSASIGQSAVSGAHETITVQDSSSIELQDILKIDDERFKVVRLYTGSLHGTAHTGSIDIVRDFHNTDNTAHSAGATVYRVDTDAEFLAGLISTPVTYNEGQVFVSTGRFNEGKTPGSSGSISSGYLLMNANPGDINTPYMDIVERTGSGVYDLELRARLGDLSGLSSAYLYGDEEPGFGLYTDNGYFRGSIQATTGSIHGILNVATIQGGIETGEKISIGRNVTGSSDGIYFNDDYNYWFTTGDFRVGSATKFMNFKNSAGTFQLQTDDLNIDTTLLDINTAHGGMISLGSGGSSSLADLGTAGIFLSGSGTFNLQQDAYNYIRKNDSSFEMKFGSVGANFVLNSADNSFRFFSGSEVVRIDDSIPVYQGGFVPDDETPTAVYTDGGIGLPTNKAKFTGSFTGRALSVYDAPTGSQNVPLIDAIRFQDTANVNPIANAVASTIFMNAAIDSAATTQYALSARVRVKNTAGLLSGECNLYGAYIDVGNTDADTGNGDAYRKVTDHADSKAYAIYANADLYQDGANSKNYGIYANAVGADGSNYAGYFNQGDVYVKNNLTVGGGYGSTGTTISSAGVIQTDGAITSGGLITGTDLTISGISTTIGTVTSGTWNGTAIATGYIAAALTSQTSMYNAALKIGRDTHNQFDFATDNAIKVSVNAVDDEFRFAAGGTFHADADIVAYSSTIASDEKLKINIENTQYGLSDVLKLRGVDFTWKEKLDGRKDVGFIAQEVQKVIPELVREVDGLKGEDSHLAIDYGKVVPILVEAVKEQQGQIDSLKKEVKILKDK